MGVAECKSLVRVSIAFLNNIFYVCMHNKSHCKYVMLCTRNKKKKEEKSG